MRTRLAPFLLVAACGHGDNAPTGAPTRAPSAPPTSAVAADIGTLSAPVSVRSSIELKARLTIVNPGPGDLALRRGSLELPMLAVEVRDAAGRRVNPVPPPVPRPEDAQLIRLLAAESLVRDYGLHIYSPELAPGTYTLHCLVVACAAVTFEVAP